MAIKTKLTVEWQSYEGTLTNNPADAVKISKYVEEDDATQVFRRVDVIADGTSDQVIPLPDTTCDYLVIFTDQSIRVKLNGSSTVIQLNPRIAPEKCPVLVLKAEITELKISNASGTDANVDIIMAVI